MHMQETIQHTHRQLTEGLGPIVMVWATSGVMTYEL